MFTVRCFFLPLLGACSNFVSASGSFLCPGTVCGVFCLHSLVRGLHHLCWSLYSDVSSFGLCVYLSSFRACLESDAILKGLQLKILEHQALSWTCFIKSNPRPWCPGCLHPKTRSRRKPQTLNRLRVQVFWKARETVHPEQQTPTHPRISEASRTNPMSVKANTPPKLICLELLNPQSPRSPKPLTLKS